MNVKRHIVFLCLAFAMSYAYSCIGSSFMQINCNMFNMSLDDGTSVVFSYDKDEKSILHSNDGWIAETNGRKTLVLDENEKNGFLFIDGMLAKTLVDGHEALANTNKVIIPNKDKALVAYDAPDIWEKSGRLRLWFDNPNKAGLLLVEFLLIMLYLSLKCKNIAMKTFNAAMSLALFIMMLMTSSRGSFLAFICGFIAMLSMFCISNRKSLAKMACICIIAYIAMVGCIFAFGKSDRFMHSLLNDNNKDVSRLIMWKEVPQMIVDAPNGWGYGNSGKAYINWYQKENTCLAKDMISGHLTLLVESHWALRIAYVTLLSFVVLMLFRLKSCLALALVVSYVVAGCFNPTIYSWSLPLIPAIAAIVCLAKRHSIMQTKHYVKIGVFSISLALASYLICIALAFILHDGVSIYKDANAICINGRKPKFWVVDDNYSMHNGYWWLAGKNEFRKAAISNNVAIGYARSIYDVPCNAETMALVGDTGRKFINVRKKFTIKKIIFISPTFSWQTIPDSIISSYDIAYVVGSLHANANNIQTYDAPNWVKVVRGAGPYIKNWFVFCN